MQDKKADSEQTVLTENALDEVDATLETSPRKSLIRIVQKTCFENMCKTCHKIVKTAII
jgi:hypothetical protein